MLCIRLEGIVLFSNLRCWLTMSKRLGAFRRYRESGMTVDQAKTQVDFDYPPSDQQVAYEKAKMEQY